MALVVKNLLTDTGSRKRHRFNLWVGKIPGEGHGNPLQYSWLENPMDRGDWRATVHGVAKSQTWLKWLSMHTHTHAPKWCWGPQEIVRWASSLNKCDLVQITQSLPPNHFFFFEVPEWNNWCVTTLSCQLSTLRHHCDPWIFASIVFHPQSYLGQLKEKIQFAEDGNVSHRVSFTLRYLL